MSRSWLYRSAVSLGLAGLFMMGLALPDAQAQEWCVPPDPDYCVTYTCGIGEGDCDPGQCDEGVCVDDVGAQYGLPAHYDVCEEWGTVPPPAGVGELLGTWRFTHGRGTDEWNFTRIDNSTGISAVVGQAESQHDVVGRITVISDEYEYAVLWHTSSLCKFYVFNLTTTTTARGVYAPSPGGKGWCGSITDIHPTTGVRTRAADQRSLSFSRQSDTSPTSLLSDLSQQLDRLRGAVR